MKFSTIAAVSFILAPAIARPTAPVDYTPPGGWESVEYPKGTGENLDYYPPPPGGWESVEYPPGTGVWKECKDEPPKHEPPKHEPPKYEEPPKHEPPKYEEPPKHEEPPHKPDDYKPDWHWKTPFHFTSVYHVIALGKYVVNGTAPNTKSTPGPPDAIGFFNYGINVHEETICYNITLINFQGEYRSPANTATHIHQGVKGATGPPRIAFPNPAPVKGNTKFRRSVGCLVGPFETGVKVDGKDTGEGFSLSQIEANPAGFFTDSHSSLFVPGIVRGQLG